MPIITTCRVWTTSQVQGLIWGIMKASEAQIREGLVSVPLYKSGVRYAREPLGSEVWQTALETKNLGCGDCEDLVAWRCAELRVAGEDATPYVKDVRPGLRHCLVRRANGALECPSRALGMGGDG
jgi:hypothetical protein